MCPAETCGFSSTHSEGQASAILGVDIHLARNVLALHGVNEPGKAESTRPAVTSSRGYSASHRWPHINAMRAPRSGLTGASQMAFATYSRGANGSGPSSSPRHPQLAAALPGIELTLRDCSRPQTLTRWQVAGADAPDGPRGRVRVGSAWHCSPGLRAR